MLKKGSTQSQGFNRINRRNESSYFSQIQSMLDTLQHNFIKAHNYTWDKQLTST